LSEDRLSNFLKTGQDWSRVRTNVPGVFVLKLPAYRSSPTRLAVELNPVDENGNPTKRRGFILRSSVELEDLNKMFQYEKISKLLTILDSINPDVEAARRRKKEEVIEL